MNIRLYTQSVNPFSQKVASALILKGIAFETVIAEEPAEIALYSPQTRELPVLEIDGERRPDSHEILRWLDERFPEPQLVSRDVKVAEQQRQLMEWADASFVFYWNRWRRAGEPRPDDDAASAGDGGLIGNLRDRLLGTSALPPAQQREDERHEQGREEVQHQEARGLEHELVAQGPAADLDHEDGARPQQAQELAADELRRDDHADHLGTAGRRARRAADEHDRTEPPI